MTLSIAIAGAGGRMGRALVRAASHDPRFSVCGGIEHSEGQFLFRRQQRTAVALN